MARNQKIERGKPQRVEGQAASQERVSEQVISQEYHQGPIPPASEMARYEEIQPGFADRVFALTERSLEAEIEDRKEVRAITANASVANADAVRRGQNYALITSAAGLASSLVALMLGSPMVAGILGGTTLTVIVASFLGVKTPRRTQRDSGS